MDLTLLAGPAALAIAASAAVIALWRAHARDDAEKDVAMRALTDAVAAFSPALRALTEIIADKRRPPRG